MGSASWLITLYNRLIRIGNIRDLQGDVRDGGSIASLNVGSDRRTRWERCRLQWAR